MLQASKFGFQLVNHSEMTLSLDLPAKYKCQFPLLLSGARVQRAQYLGMPSNVGIGLCI